MATNGNQLDVSLVPDDGEGMMDATEVKIEDGDVIELDVDGERTTALVLLTSEESLIADPCDGRVPLVLRYEQLESVRVFRPELVAA
jgi:hypothetical protein